MTSSRSTSLPTFVLPLHRLLERTLVVACDEVQVPRPSDGQLSQMATQAESRLRERTADRTARPDWEAEAAAAMLLVLRPWLAEAAPPPTSELTAEFLHLEAAAWTDPAHPASWEHPALWENEVS